MLGQPRGLLEKINSLIREYEVALDRGDRAEADSLHRLIATLVRFRTSCLNGRRLS